jgi:hypothetical protein
VLRSPVGAPLAFRKDSESVVRLCHVRIEPPRSCEKLARSREVPTLALDQPEIDERLHEVRTVFEGQAQAGVCGDEVTGGESCSARLVQEHGFRGQWSLPCTAEYGQNSQ